MKNRELDSARALYYGFFSLAFSFIENRENFQKLVEMITYLSKSPIEENSKSAFENIENFLKKENAQELLLDENNNIFFSPSTTFIPMTASFYIEDRDDGKKRVEMTNIVLKSKFRRDSQNFKEAEDHICFIFSFLQKLLNDENEDEIILEVFSNILNGMIDEFIESLHSHECSEFYKDIAVLLKVFIELERALLNVKSVEKKEKRVQQNIFQREKKEFKKRAKRDFEEV
ncbi:TorD/DmsD family molecular chaperone [Halarcobacter ebronensis]|uniref:Uncharacterized protein n=1 Tax=Halarcobacter ebronensis TaxID=1462615 RepID=A0A4Q1ATI9_9BACT|nr:molecular chaperone TorD family protein [Halarcobacter ebronensis]QKF81795.1 putative formate dehydrogenase-specific chaperone [Halarcobacter ebronensis]RXK04533.1 hypothetical protein CRV07_10260 [Halarcobacter ebronensis]